MNNIVISISYELKNIEAWDSILDRFDKNGYFVYELNNVPKSSISIEDFPSIIEQYSSYHSKIDHIVLVSNIRELVFSWFRCYNSLVDDFIYFDNEYETCFLSIEDDHFPFYQSLIEFYRIEEDALEDKLFIFSNSTVNYPIFSNNEYITSYKKYDPNLRKQKKQRNKRYKYGEYEYSFITSEKSKFDNVIKLDLKRQIFRLFKPDDDSQKKALSLFKKVCGLRKVCTENKNIQKCKLEIVSMDVYISNALKTEVVDLRLLEFLIRDLVFGKKQNERFDIFILTLLFSFTQKREYLYILHKKLKSTITIDKYELFFLGDRCLTPI